MQGRAEETRCGPIPLGLIGMAGIVIAVELFLARHDLDFATASSSCWHQGRLSARRQAPRCEILCLGDSMVKMGVLPRVLEARTGRKAYNLALIGGQVPASYFQLRRALEAGGRPGLVLVDFAPHILATNPHCCMRHWAEFATTRECFELAWTSRDAGFFLETMAGRILRSVRARCEIRENLLAAFRGQGPPARGDLPAFWRNWNVNQGALVLRERSRFDGKIEPNETTSFFPPYWACDPINQSYLHRFLKLADEYKVRVYWLLPPISPELHRGREQLGLETLHTQFVEEFLAQFPSLSVIDGRYAGYDHEAFNDAVHLNGQGASNLTEDLASLLREEPVIRGWLRLPAYQGRPLDAPLEDTARSVVALRSRGGYSR